MASHDRELTEERERFLRDLQVIAGLGIYVLDITTGRWTSSEVLDGLLGLEASSEHSVEVWGALLHPDDRRMMVRYFFQTVVQKRRPFDKEYRIIRRRDGVERWVHGRGQLEVNAQGQPVRMIGTIQDITERKRSDEALRNSESRYRELVELAVDGILLGSHEGVVIEANRRLCELVGMTREQLQGKHILDLPFTRECLEQSPFRFDLLQKGEVVVTERTLVRSDKTEIVAEMRTKMMPDGTYQSIYRDITARKRADESVTESQRALSTLLGNLQGMAYRCKNDPNWTMEYFSPGVKALTGYAAADFINNAKLAYADVIHPDDRSPVHDEVQKAILRRQHFQLVYRILTADGALKWVWEKGVGIFAFTGELLAIEGFIADITERKQAEDDLRSLTETLEQRVAERTRELEAANEALHKSHALLNETGKVAHVGGWELDLGTGDQVWTDEVYRIHEVERDYKPMLGTGLAFYAPESRAIIDRVVQRAIEHGEPFDEELEIITAKGHRRWVRAVGQMDQPRGKMFGIFQDITERKQADAALKTKNAALLRSVVQLRKLAAELTQAEECERKRLAGRLHDDLQPLLVAATIKVSLLDRRVNKKDHAKAVQEVLELLGETLQASRALTTDLYPPVLLDAGLAPGLRWLAEWMKAKHGLTVVLEVDESLDIPESLSILLFRAARELLLNVVKHAKTSSALVNMEQTDTGSLRLTIRDKGCGFLTAPPVASPASDGFGLFHLREHLAYLGGALDVASESGKGTQVSITVPFSA